MSQPSASVKDTMRPGETPREPKCSHTPDIKEKKGQTLLVLATLFLLDTVNDGTGLTNQACKFALRVHVANLLHRTDGLATNEK